MARGALGVGLLLCACGDPTPSLDTSCPSSGATAEALIAGIGERGLPGPPETARFDLGGHVVLVAWKNLLSGRALTLSCAYRPQDSTWKLVRARLDEGTHALRLSARREPPAVIYRDADGRLLGELAVEPY